METFSQNEKIFLADLIKKLEGHKIKIQNEITELTGGANSLRDALSKFDKKANLKDAVKVLQKELKGIDINQKELTQKLDKYNQALSILSELCQHE